MIDILAEGKRNQTEGLDTVLKYVQDDHSLIPDLLKFASFPQANIAARAIWVARQIADTEPSLLQNHKTYVITELTKSAFWEVKAELCHIIPKLPLDKNEAEVVITFFEGCQSDKSKIVRAWSLNGLYEASKIIPEISDKVSDLLAVAVNSGVASISARARNILKEIKSL